jgi:uncharacterized protein YndB with AHSA1/START domain
VSRTDAVRVTTFVARDPAATFRVFTDEIDGWWQRGPRARLNAPRRGTLRFVDRERLEESFAGGEICVIGRVLAWEPGARLRFEWRTPDFAPGERTEVEVLFAAEGTGTRVTLEHRGWDALPADHPARHGLRGGAFTALIGHHWADLLFLLGSPG